LHVEASGKICTQCWNAQSTIFHRPLLGLIFPSRMKLESLNAKIESHVPPLIKLTPSPLQSAPSQVYSYAIGGFLKGIIYSNLPCLELSWMLERLTVCSSTPHSPFSRGSSQHKHQTLTTIWKGRESVVVCHHVSSCVMLEPLLPPCF
jgi:hypothetical protein